MAFAETHPDGDRSFSFYRNPGADMMLRIEDINEKLLGQTKIFHFGTLSMTHENIRKATMYAVETAKKNGAFISFDPNIREMLWESLETAKEQVHYGLKMCDVLKISDNEIQWLTGEQDFTAGVERIREKYKIPLILVLMGKDGSRAYYLKDDSSEIIVEERAVLQKNTIETTGAGDTFMGCILHFILNKGLGNLERSDLSEMLRFANSAASIITTRKGALRVMPNLQEIEENIIV